MIEFMKWPPEEPGDVVLSEYGLNTLKAVSRARRQAPSDQPLFQMTGHEAKFQIAARLQTIGETLGSTVLAAVEHPNTVEAMQIGGHLANQFRETIETEDDRWIGQAFGTGIWVGMNEYRHLTTMSEGVTA
jgi:hypothetical protein